jgi:hypothetical protein
MSKNMQRVAGEKGLTNTVKALQDLGKAQEGVMEKNNDIENGINAMLKVSTETSKHVAAMTQVIQQQGVETKAALENLQAAVDRLTPAPAPSWDNPGEMTADQLVAVLKVKGFKVDDQAVLTDELAAAEKHYGRKWYYAAAAVLATGATTYAGYYLGSRGGEVDNVVEMREAV